MAAKVKRPILALEYFVPSPFRAHSIYFWLFVGITLALTCFFIAPQDETRAAYLGFSYSNLLGMIAIPIVFRLCHQWLSAWGSNVHKFAYVAGLKEKDSDTKVQAWVSRNLEFFEGSRAMYLTGACLGILSVIIFRTANYPIGEANTALLLAAAILSISAFFAGCGLYAVYSGYLLIRRLANFNIRVRNRHFGIANTGWLLVKCYFVIAIAWSFYVLSAFLGLQTFELNTVYKALPMLLLGIPSQVIIIGFFVLAQLPLHQRMVEYKQAELLKAEHILDQLERYTAVKLTRDMRDKRDFFERRRAEISSLPEWPFGYKEFSGAIVSGVTVITPTWISALFPLIARSG